MGKRDLISILPVSRYNFKTGPLGVIGNSASACSSISVLVNGDTAMLVTLQVKAVFLLYGDDNG